MSNPALIARFEYGGFTGQNPHPPYKLVAVQSTEAAFVAAYKAANPGTLVYVYLDTFSSKCGDPSGRSTLAPTYPPTSTWPAKDGSGNLMQVKTSYIPACVSGTNYVMDPASPSLRTAAITHALSILAGAPYDGIFLDNVFSTVAGGNSVAVPVYSNTGTAYTASTWRSAMLGYLAALQAGVGVPLIGNISYLGDGGAYWRSVLGVIGGAMEESWTDGNVGIAQQYTPTNYTAAKMANVTWAEANNKLVVVHTYNTTQAGDVFGLAVMLLVANGNTVFTVNPGTAYTAANEPWYPAYDTARSLGSPRGAYTTNANGTQQRLFDNGVVLVNPTGAPAGGLAAYTASITFTGTSPVNFTAVASFAGRNSRATTHKLSGRVFANVSAGKVLFRLSRSVTAAGAFTGRFKRKSVHTMSGGLASVGVSRRQVRHTLKGALSSIGSARHAVARRLTGVFATHGAIGGPGPQDLFGTVSFTGAIKRKVIRPIGAQLLVQGALLRNLRHSLAASVTFVTTHGKGLSRAISGLFSLSAGFSRSIVRSVRAVLDVADDFFGARAKNLTASIAFTSPKVQLPIRQLRSSLSFAGAVVSPPKKAVVLLWRNIKTTYLALTDNSGQNVVQTAVIPDGEWQIQENPGAGYIVLETSPGTIIIYRGQ